MSRHVLSVLSALVIIVAGCGDSTGPESVAGTYHLETVGGHPLPYTDYDDGVFKHVIVSEAMTLNADKTFSYTFKGLATNQGGTAEESDTYTGTWTLDKDKLTVVFPQQEFIMQATLTNKTITVADPDSGLSAVFRKE